MVCSAALDAPRNRYGESQADAAENWSAAGRIGDVAAMSWIASATTPVLATGEVRLIESIDWSPQLQQAENRGLLPVTLPSPGPSARGRLALLIEEAVEEALQKRGACAPGVGAATSLEASLNDQLYRARLLERRGIALALPSLRGMASLAGVLDADDSAVLRWWLDATERASLWLLLDDSNAELGVYGPPRPLADLVSARERVVGHHEESPRLDPEVCASSAAMNLSGPPPAVVERDGALAFEQPMDDDEPAAPSTVLTATASVRVQTSIPDGAAAGSPPEGSGALRLGDLTQALLQTLSGLQPVTGSPQPTDVEPERTETRQIEEPPPRQPPVETHATPLAAIAVPPLYPNAPSEWRTWAQDLETARGARPLAAVERMFVASYIPLREALMRGVADASAAKVLERWSESFAQSYREAFDALRLRGKRPTMVLDVPEVALRIGRLHGARSVQLLLIDGMRFDLGLRIEQRVRALLGQQAALTERLLLWSALPTTTEMQLELLGRGPDGLKELSLPQDGEIPVARGRAARTLRRVKTGHRELLKLDFVQAALSETGSAEPERLDSIAAETALILAEYLEKQMPRTLVLAFGDHGFLLDRLDGGTAAAHGGGASPDEVLVPAFAWLVGGVH